MDRFDLMLLANLEMLKIEHNERQRIKGIINGYVTEDQRNFVNNLDSKKAYIMWTHFLAVNLQKINSGEILNSDDFNEFELYTVMIKDRDLKDVYYEAIDRELKNYQRKVLLVRKNFTDSGVRYIPDDYQQKFLNVGRKLFGDDVEVDIAFEEDNKRYIDGFKTLLRETDVFDEVLWETTDVKLTEMVLKDEVNEMFKNRYVDMLLRKSMQYRKDGIDIFSDEKLVENKFGKENIEDICGVMIANLSKDFKKNNGKEKGR